jgi:hypothetical protein
MATTSPQSTFNQLIDGERSEVIAGHDHLKTTERTMQRSERKTGHVALPPHATHSSV